MVWEFYALVWSYALNMVQNCYLWGFSLHLKQSEVGDQACKGGCQYNLSGRYLGTTLWVLKLCQIWDPQEESHGGTSKHESTRGPFDARWHSCIVGPACNLQVSVTRIVRSQHWNFQWKSLLKNPSSKLILRYPKHNGMKSVHLWCWFWYFNVNSGHNVTLIVRMTKLILQSPVPKLVHSILERWNLLQNQTVCSKLLNYHRQILHSSNISLLPSNTNTN
jgi:hypothetical protein